MATRYDNHEIGWFGDLFTLPRKEVFSNFNHLSVRCFLSAATLFGWENKYMNCYIQIPYTEVIAVVAKNNIEYVAAPAPFECSSWS